MTVKKFVRKDYVSDSAFTGVADLKNQLLQHSAVVIMEEDHYFGILTATDIIRKPHIIAIDCISNKTEIEQDRSISDTLFIMKRDNTDVLPVFDKKEFLGVVFKSDILEHLNEHNQKLQNEITSYSKRIEDQDSEFKLQIQHQKEELEKIIDQRTKELIDLVETKEKFIRIIIHELRNPFNGILGFLSLLQKNLREYDINIVEKYLTNIYRSATVTFELLVNLSEWLNAKNNKIPFNPEITYINELLTDEISTTSLLLEQKKISLNNNIPKKLYAFVDKNMVKTIFRNLIVNAAKYTDVDGEIIISASQNDEFVEISVKDTGVGLSPEFVDTLFNKEGRLTSLEGTTGETGTGLGLLLCKEFVEIEGGKIWVESILGTGSEFKFTLPKKEETKKQILR